MASKLYKYSKLYQTISFWYAICFFYKLIYQYFIFIPVINSVRKSDICNEIYFSNEIGGYLWPPTDTTTPLYQKCLFYMNDFSGNSTARFGLIHRIQREFPSYTFIQLDYAGFGISYRLNLNLNEIIYRMHETVQIILKTNRVQKFGFWTESVGIQILSKMLYNDPTIQPSFLICYNITDTFWKHYKNEYSVFCLPFLLPCMTYKPVSQLLNQTKVKETLKLILFHDEKKHQKLMSLQQYYALKVIPFSKKCIVPLKGAGISSFFLPENETSISSSLKKIS